MTVFVYVNTSKQVGAPSISRSSPPRMQRQPGFAENDPEGVAYEVKGPPA
jgi:hypothetical protein